MIPAPSVLGSGPFREIGRPSAIAIAGDLVAVGGSLGLPQWAGASLQRVVGGSGWERIGVYERATLECSVLVPSRWPVHALSFDPSASYLAIASGSYDGGFFYEGELLLVDVGRREAVSLLRESREVKDVGWAADGAVEIVVSPTSDEDDPELRRFRIPHRLWAAFEPRSVSLDELESGLCDPPAATAGEVDRELDLLAERAGDSRTVRRQVWDVDIDASGDVLASLEGVRLEAWTPTGVRRFAVEADGRGCQLEALSDRHLLTLVEPTWRPTEDGFARKAGSVEVRDRVGGDLVAAIEVTFPVVAAGAADGSFLLRDVSVKKANAGAALHFTDAAAPGVPLEVGGYDLVNHAFRVRHAPEVLVLVGDEEQPWRDKWIARIVRRGRWFGRRPSLAVERMFPLEWDAERNGHLMGGPGCWLADVRDSSLVHAGWIHDGAGLLRGNSFLVRRSQQSGALQWEVRADAQFSGVDVVDTRIWATLLSGELLCIDAGTGEVLEETVLEVGGHPVVPLSMCGAPGRLAIGLLDGRILRIDL